MKIKTILKLAGSMAVALAATACGNGDGTTDRDATSRRHNVYITTPQDLGSGATSDYSATVEEGKSVNAGFKTGGQVSRILVDEGDYVKKGQTIAILDDSDYRLSVKQLEVQYNQMGNEIARLDEMFARGNVAPNDYEKAKAGYEQLRVQLDLTRNKLAYTRLEAPVSGHVVERFMEEGEMVGGGTPIVRILDNSSLETTVAVPADVYATRSGIASVTGRSRFTGQREISLDVIGFIPDGDNNSLYRLRLRLPADVRGQLTPGMNMTVSITYGSTDDTTVRIPSRSIFEKEGKRYVWAIGSDSTISAQQVSVVGPTDTDGFSRVGGLDAGTAVVAAGVHHLVEGEKVGIIGEIDNLKNSIGL